MLQPLAKICLRLKKTVYFLIVYMCLILNIYQGNKKVLCLLLFSKNNSKTTLTNNRTIVIVLLVVHCSVVVSEHITQQKHKLLDCIFQSYHDIPHDTIHFLINCNITILQINIFSPNFISILHILKTKNINIILQFFKMLKSDLKYIIMFIIAFMQVLYIYSFIDSTTR